MSTLKSVLKEQGRSLIWLADQLEVSDQTIRNWRKGRPVPKVYREAICRLLDVEDIHIDDHHG